jgi:uncharacterized protein involved in tolerance to divalent cations
MARKEPKDEERQEIELPKEIIESFARFLVPEIKKYYESEQGQREYAEWIEKQQNEKE